MGIPVETVHHEDIEVQITPGVPVFTKYLAEAVVGSGAGGVTPGGRGLSLIG